MGTMAFSRPLRRLAFFTLAAMAAIARAEAPATQPESTVPHVAAPTTAPAEVADPRNAVVIERMLDEPTRRIVKLANGLTIILQENHTAPVVAARVYIKAGSLTEQQYMGCGISHVLEHLVIGASSARRNQNQNDTLLRSIGNHSNAYTTYDHTCYFITTTPEKWAVSMDLLSEWVTDAAFTPKEFAREYQVVQRELEMGEAEAMRTFAKLVYANRYQVFPAKHPVIGYKPAFQKLTRDDCYGYYKQMYIPDNMIVSIAGDINLDDAQKLVAEKFSHVGRKKVPSISLPAEPPVAAPRVMVGRADVREARACWSFPTVDMYSPDLYALDVLANVLGQGESSVLVRSLRDQKGLVTSIGADNNTPHYAAGSLDFVAELPAGNVEKTQQSLLEELQHAKEKIDPKAVEKAKAQMAAALVYARQTAEEQASENASDFMSTGNIDFSKQYVEKIQQVTPEQVRAAAEKYIQANSLLTTILLPLKAPAPELAGTGTQTETTDAKSVTKTVLPNGLTVLICHNSSAPLVTLNYYTLGGLLAEDANNNGIGNAMLHLMTRGTESRSHDQIADFFDSTGGSFEVTSGNNSFGIAATCLKEHGADTLNVMADIILHPSLSAEQLEKIRPQLLAAVDHATEDWFGEGYKFMRASYWDKSPYKQLPTGQHDVVAKLTAEQIRKHYETYLRDPAHTVIAVYGDIDKEDVAKWAQQFAAIPKTDPKLNLEAVRAPGGTVTQQSQKQSATVFYGYGPGMTLTDADRYPMTVLQTILGGYSSPGGSWLHETLRGQGLVYTVQAQNIPAPFPGMFMIVALGEPQNVPKITTLINQRIDDAKKGLFTEQEIALAKDQAITGQKLAAQTVAAQAQMQALDELYGLGYNAHEQYAPSILKVTHDDLVRVANKYLVNPVIAITSPDAK
jgi:zinc protease